MLTIGGISILGVVWMTLAFTCWVGSILTGKKPKHGGPRKHAGLRWRHTTDTRWK